MSASRLLMLSAMYENGGNLVLRHLDGHPALRVYPFESQLGTGLISDDLSGLFPSRYRWPIFSMADDAGRAYDRILDSELRYRLSHPHASKFREVPIELDEAERRARLIELLAGRTLTPGALVMAFFRATFESWRNHAGPAGAGWTVGFSPIVVVDADRLFHDLPDARLLHVVRRPDAAYADSRQRPTAPSLDGYMTRWCLVQQRALLARARYPERVRLLRLEALLDEPQRVLTELCEWLGIAADPALERPSWNGTPRDDVAPFGVLSARPGRRARALSSRERGEIARYADPYLEEIYA